MADRAAETQLFERYLADLSRAHDLGTAQERERASAERNARAVHDEALRGERAARDRASAAAKAVDAASARISRLVARSGAIPAQATSTPLPQRLEDFERATTSLNADIRAAESSWDWVERARQAPAAPAPAMAPNLPSPAVQADSNATPEPKGRGCALFALAILVNLGLIALLVAIFSA